VRWYRPLFEGLLLFAAVFLQVGVLARLGLPGATPDLVLVYVAALAMLRGPLVGSIAGFSAGLLLDLVPPSTGTLGITALLLLIVGYGAGRFGGDEHAIIRPLMVITVSSAFFVLAYGLISGLLDRRAFVWDTLPLIAGTEILYCLILATFVVPGMTWLEKKMISLQSRGFRDI
jgi:rod shape-determining protein MreD